MLSVRAITFDLDDTLWDVWPIIVRAEERLHDWLAHRYPRITDRFTPLELRQICDEVSVNKPHIAHDRNLLRKEALSLAAQRVGYGDFEVDPAFGVFFAARNDVVFFDDVLSVLERLTRCYTLGALSNGNADIRLVGLGHVFDFAFNAVAVGAAKPEPAMFEAACRHLSLPAEQILHVGDDPHHDVQGAAQVGLRTVWVNRTQRDWPGGQRADAEIQSLEELEGLLEQRA